MKAEIINQQEINANKNKVINCNQLKIGEMGRIIDHEIISGLVVVKVDEKCGISHCIIIHVPTITQQKIINKHGITYLNYCWSAGKPFSNNVYKLEKVRYVNGDFITIKDEKEEFTPVEFKVTAETLDELNYLWGITNIDVHTVRDYNKSYGINFGKIDVMPFFNCVDDFMVDCGFKKDV